MPCSPFDRVLVTNSYFLPCPAHRPTPSTFLIETLSPPGSLAPTLAALPSMSLLPFAPFLLLTFPRALLNQKSIAPVASGVLWKTGCLRSWKNPSAFSPRRVCDLLSYFRERSAHFTSELKLTRCPTLDSLLPSQLYVLCCSSRSLHSYFLILTSFMNPLSDTFV
jgi:hypothetical protein